LSFDIRVMEQQDKSACKFVKSYWLDSYSRSRIAQMIPLGVYHENHTKLINKALFMCKTVLLSDPQDSDHLIGFANGFKVDTNRALNYIFIKKAFRSHNLGVKLHDELFGSNPAESPILTITHQGNVGGVSKLYQKVIFNPYLFQSI